MNSNRVVKFSGLGEVTKMFEYLKKGTKNPFTHRLAIDSKKTAQKIQNGQMILILFTAHFYKQENLICQSFNSKI